MRMDRTEPSGEARPMGNRESAYNLLNKYAAGIRITKMDMVL